MLSILTRWNIIKCKHRFIGINKGKSCRKLTFNYSERRIIMVKCLVHTYVNNNNNKNNNVQVLYVSLLEKYRKWIYVYSYSHIKIRIFSCHKQCCIELFSVIIHFYHPITNIKLIKKPPCKPFFFYPFLAGIILVAFGGEIVKYIMCYVRHN